MASTTVRFQFDLGTFRDAAEDIRAVLLPLPEGSRTALADLACDLMDESARQFLGDDSLPAAEAGVVTFRVEFPWLSKFCAAARAAQLDVVAGHGAPPGNASVSGDPERSTGGASIFEMPPEAS